MPVPVSVTHGKRAGLEAADHAELPTSGPFARNAQLKHDKEEVEDPKEREEAMEIEDTMGVGAGSVEEQKVAAVETKDLSFWYCDIGARRCGCWCWCGNVG